MRDMQRSGEKRYFWVPINENGEGRIIETLDDEKAYDHGSKGNWSLVMGQGWKWLWPPNALLGTIGMRHDQVLNWPVAPTVAQRLREEAFRTFQDDDNHDVLHADD